LIIDRYRELFDLAGGLTSAMDWGFQFSGYGWLRAMDHLCERLVPLVAGSGCQITGVKSKFGTLRIAYRGGSDAISAEIETCKQAALVTCENCGAAGTRQQVGGWAAVRCVACAEPLHLGT
jgi:hypothetical protein